MIIIDELLKKSDIRVGLVGVGFIGGGLARRLTAMQGFNLVIVCDRAAPKPFISGKSEIRFTADLDEALESDIDVIVDATGSVEYGVRVATGAIRRNLPLVMVNVEMDATVGPMIQRMADAAGVPITQSDGDQPGSEMNLYRFIAGMGFTPRLCGNMKFFQDHHANPETVLPFAAGQNPRTISSFADGTKMSMEQAVVGNALGWGVAKSGMSGIPYRGNIDDVEIIKEFEKIIGDGPCLVDYVLHARPHAGVFVLATNEDGYMDPYFDAYKLRRRGTNLFSFYVPYHLCHFEMPFTIARLVLLHDRVMSARHAAVDVAAVSKRDLKAGEVLDGFGGFMVRGRCENYRYAREYRLLPVGLAGSDARMVRDVQADTPLTYDDVEIPDSPAVVLRREMERIF